MSATARTRTELYKLRELVHFLLCGAGATPRAAGEFGGAYCCYFCGMKLDTYAADFVEHGNAKGPKFDAEISIHHLDGDHDNNKLSNKALSHRSCHKGHHRRLANQQRALERTLGAQA